MSGTVMRLRTRGATSPRLSYSDLTPVSADTTVIRLFVWVSDATITALDQPYFPPRLLAVVVLHCRVGCAYGRSDISHVLLYLHR